MIVAANGKIATFVINTLPRDSPGGPVAVDCTLPILSTKGTRV